MGGLQRNERKLQNMLCLLKKSIGEMMRTELAALRDSLTVFQIVLERILG
jgi:hypothetical protein